MNESEFLSRRAVIGAGGLGAAAVVGVALLQSSQAQANLPAVAASFKFKSVLDYGVTPNDPGGADQTADLQDALDDLHSNDCLVIPAGVYKVTAGILSRTGALDNIQILAYGAMFQIVDSAGGGNHDVLTLSSTPSVGNDTSNMKNISIHGLKITSMTTTYGSGIVLNNVPRFALRDVSIWNMGAYCLEAHNSWWLSTENCQFLAAGTASVYQNGQMNSVTHIGSRFAPYAFPAAQGSGNPYNANAAGVIHEGGTSVNFIGCDFSGCQIGALIRQGGNTTFTGSYFEDVVVGIQLGNGSDTSFNTTIDNCYFSMRNTTGLIGIDINRAESALIRNNYVLTKQPADTTTIRYDNTKAANKNAIIDANRCVNGTLGSNMDFIATIAYVNPSITTNKIKKYTIADA